MDESDYWMRRFEHYDKAARSLYERSIQLVGTSLTLLLAATTALVAYGKFEVLLAVPLVVVLIWSVAAKLLEEQLLLAVYRDYAEARCNAAMGGDSSQFSLWHIYGGKTIATGVPNQLTYLVIAGISLGLIVVPLIASPTNAGSSIWPYWIAVVLFIVASLIAAAVSFSIINARTIRSYEDLRRGR